jgi:hypothetical protein
LGAANIGTYVEQIDKATMLPLILPRAPNWNGYAHYGVNTRRGLKQAAKGDWATQVIAHWIGVGYCGNA